MVIKIVIGILVLTAVTYVMVFVVLPRVGTNANQSVLYQSNNPSTASRQENTNSAGIHSPGNSGNPATVNTSSNSNPAITSSQFPYTSNTIENSSSATTDKLIAKLLTEKQYPELERLIQEIKKRGTQEAITDLTAKIKQTTGPERARHIMILGRFENENTLPLLAGLFNDADKGTKFTALSAIAGFGTEKSTTMLLDFSAKAIEDFDKEMIGQMFFKMEPIKAIPNFIAALSNEDTGVILKANEFLEKFSKSTYTVNPEDNTSVTNAKEYWQAWWEEYKSKNN